MIDGLFDKGYADIQMSHAAIQVGNENVKHVVDTNAGMETRPDNIHVAWIEGSTNLSPDSFPVGSIVAWLPITNAHGMDTLPPGWVECNGEGDKIPDINGKKLFLRGSNAESAGEIEAFQIQDHTHDDLGHTHTDVGHTHIDLGHEAGKYEILVPGDHYGDADGGGHFAMDAIIDILKLTSSNANLDIAKANIDTSKALIKDVINAQTSKEARPKNVGVKFIMKIC